MPSVSNLVQLTFTPEQAKEIAAQGGWCDIDEAWTYFDAQTAIVPTDATTRFQVGDKVRLTNDGSVKYFYVTEVSATGLTLRAGSVYTLADAAISSVAYSRAQDPFGFPSKFAYAPPHTGFAASPTVSAWFCMQGRLVTVFYTTNAGGTSNATSFKVGAPVNVNGTTGYVAYGVAYGVDNGTALTGAYASVYSGDATNIILNVAAGGAWTNAGDKYAYFSISYLAAV